MDNEFPIVGSFVGEGLPGYVVIPDLLIMWNMVPDHIARSGEDSGDPSSFSAGMGG